MLLTFLLAAVLWNCNCWWNAANIYTFAVQPGYLDFDNLPETNFSCDGKVIGGYYADVETGCQMFHVCTIGQKAEITDIKFLCLNGTVFDQETRVCERLDEVDCSRSESFFDLNLELYGNNGAGYGIQPEEQPEQEPAQCDNEEEDCSGTPDYFSEDVTTAQPAPIAQPPPTTTTTSTTTTTTTTTTTRRPPTTTTSTTRLPPVSYPTNSPETIAALIALHNAFQESLKERDHHHPSLQKLSPTASHVQRYPMPALPKPFTVANFQPPRHFPSKPQQLQPPPPPPSQYQQQLHQPVLFSSERFGNQNFRHGYRLQNGPTPSAETPQPPTFQQYSDGQAYYDDDDDDDTSRRNFAREAPEASVSVHVQVSSSSSKNSAINNNGNRPQQQPQRRPSTVSKSTTSGPPQTTSTVATTTTTTAAPVTTAQAVLPSADDDLYDDIGDDEYGDEQLQDREDEEFFKEVPKLGKKRKRRRKRDVVGDLST
ncbi:mucin-2-like [Adelges cooleyi]|uniref:mucin-2-like n=1 Tax=Adelges cooleyi TaxID=133065 RepID=UPI00217F3CD7|nr:mucin-2-like [Adelges cooleyi]